MLGHIHLLELHTKGEGCSEGIMIKALWIPGNPQEIIEKLKTFDVEIKGLEKQVFDGDGCLRKEKA